MKYDCDKKRRQKYERKLKKYEAKSRIPKRVFAFWPVKVGEHDCRWLEYVEKQWFLDPVWLEHARKALTNKAYGWCSDALRMLGHESFYIYHSLSKEA